MFKRFMIFAAVISGVLTVALTAFQIIYPHGITESLAITAGTCFYHFAMRLAVGTAFMLFPKHDPQNIWFREKPFETKLYKFLRVKRWKAYAPTYDPETFDVTKHSLQEITNAMCHSELVHETIALLSFLPLLMTIPFGEFVVFLLTSVGAAAFDLIFAVIQRYNRPRILRLIKRTKSSDHR